MLLLHMLLGLPMLTLEIQETVGIFPIAPLPIRDIQYVIFLANNN